MSTGIPPAGLPPSTEDTEHTALIMKRLAEFWQEQVAEVRREARHEYVALT